MTNATTCTYKMRFIENETTAALPEGILSQVQENYRNGPKHEGDAGLDLSYVGPEVTIAPNQTVMGATGLAIWIQSRSMAGLILPRSGLGSRGLVVGNLVGLIDSGYQGELKVSMWNRTDEPITVKPGDKVCQLVIVPVVAHTAELVDSFEAATDRGTDGFNSTGVSL